MDRVPPALAEVVEPLREADDYARLQAIRQRGLYNVVTGLPGLLFVLPSLFPLLLGGNRPQAGLLLVSLVVWVLFFLACFPQAFLPLVRRHRPDWQSPLLEANLLKKGLEKQFWIQLPFWLAYFLVISFVLGVLVFGGALGSLGFATARIVVLAAGLLLHVGATVVLSWQARRNGDGLLRKAFLAAAPLAALPFLDPGGQLPSLLGMGLFAVAVFVPPIAVGLVRLLAPRRWLLK